MSEAPRGAWPQGTPTDQVALQIRKAIGEGRDQVTVRLEPAELGRIEIRLGTSSDGVIRAAIVADRAETLDLLQTDSRALERALQDAGLKTSNDSLNFSLRGDGQHGRFAQRDGSDGADQRLGDPDQEAGDDHEAQHSGRSRHDGALDISV